MVVSKTKDEAVLFLVRVLNAASVYEDQETGLCYSGDVLCRAR